MTYYIDYIDTTTSAKVHMAIKASAMEEAQVLFSEMCTRLKLSVGSYTITGAKEVTPRTGTPI